MYVTLEGVDGSGKGVLGKMLQRDLKNRDLRCVLTREPGTPHSGFCLDVATLIETHAISARTEMLLFLADRAEHYETVIRPALAQGAVVISQRGPDSTWVYQGFMLDQDLDLIERLNTYAQAGARPELTLWLDVSPALSQARARYRPPGRSFKYDHEDLATYRHLRAGYSTLAARDPERFRTVAVGDRDSKELVFQKVKALLYPMLRLDPEIRGNDEARAGSPRRPSRTQ